MFSTFLGPSPANLGLTLAPDITENLYKTKEASGKSHKVVDMGCLIFRTRTWDASSRQGQEAWKPVAWLENSGLEAPVQEGWDIAPLRGLFLF